MNTGLINTFRCLTDMQIEGHILQKAQSQQKKTLFLHGPTACLIPHARRWGSWRRRRRKHKTSRKRDSLKYRTSTAWEEKKARRRKEKTSWRRTRRIRTSPCWVVHKLTGPEGKQKILTINILRRRGKSTVPVQSKMFSSTYRRGNPKRKECQKNYTDETKARLQLEQ